jgi:hypothetical protein
MDGEPLFDPPASFHPKLAPRRASHFDQLLPRGAQRF